MAWGVRGVIEGFYGPPWSWDRRAQVMRWCAERGMTHYLYAPKDDPLHREHWRELYPDEACRRFRTLVEADTLTVGFAVSPGLSIDYRSPVDRRMLLQKLLQMTDLGIRLVCLALDDIPPRPGLGRDHADLTTWLREQLDDDIDLVLVPTEYAGTASSPYLDVLADGVPTEVPIAWTGRTVVCDAITAADAKARAAAVGDRLPLVWDNYPVNDAMMADRMFLGPLRGRAPDLAEICSGFVANPMVQPLASRLPLSSVAAFLRGEDPVAAWRSDADQLGIRAFAEACDGEHPRDLVRAVVRATGAARVDALAELRTWIHAADQPLALDEGAADELTPWAEQLHRELAVAKVAVRTLRLLAEGDTARATEQGLALTMTWPPVTRGDRSVMGPRRSVRPVFGQWPDGTWRFEMGALTEDQNATDALVRFALHELAAASAS